MKNARVIFAPEVDAAIMDLIDHVGVDEVPAVLDFLERVQKKLVGTLSAFPEGGRRFQGKLRMFPVEKYTFLYEYHAEQNEVHVLEMKAPGLDWR